MDLIRPQGHIVTIVKNNEPLEQNEMKLKAATTPDHWHTKMLNVCHAADVAAAKKDMLTFMSIIAEQWYSLHARFIREQDPNHLILGDKNMVMWHYDFMLPAIKKHVDVVCVQAYGPWENDRKLTDMIYEATGKPIFNGDGCFGLAGPNEATRRAIRMGSLIHWSSFAPNGPTFSKPSIRKLRICISLPRSPSNVFVHILSRTRINSMPASKTGSARGGPEAYLPSQEC